MFALPSGEVRITGALTDRAYRIETLVSQLSFSFAGSNATQQQQQLEYLVVNRTDSTVCLVGGRCIWVVDIPRNAAVAAQRSANTARASRVLEHFLETREHIDVLRVEWHPLSPSHLAVLTSDNTLRYVMLIGQHDTRPTLQAAAAQTMSISLMLMMLIWLSLLL